MSGPTKYNQKGMFENATIRQDLVKPYLRKISCDPMGQHPLPTDEHLQRISSSDGVSWREEVLRVMRRQGLKPDRDWFYKGAKMCLTWRLWDYAFPNAKWVIVRRDKDDIAKSCLRTGFMRAFDDVGGWRGWVDEHERRFAEMQMSGLWYMEVWPEKIINQDLTEIKDVIEGLGLKYNEANIKAFIAPSLWRRGRPK